MSVPRVPLGNILVPAPVRRAGDRDYPLLSMTMRDGLVEQGQKFKKRVASRETDNYRVVKRGELVVGFPIDEAVLATQRIVDEGIVSPAYAVWSIDTGIADSIYLERFLRSSEAISYYKANLRGTTARRRTLPPDKFRDMPVPLPSLEKQRLFALMLDRADAIRIKRAQCLSLADQLLRSVFVDMFGDPTHNEKQLPKKPLSTLGRIVTGNTPPRSDPDNFGNAIEWIKSDNIMAEGYFLTSAAEGLSEKGMALGRVVPKGSILVTCIAGSPASIGRAAIADRPVSLNQQINAITPNKTVDLYFLYAQFLVGKSLILKSSTNSMKGMVSKGEFQRIEFLYPALNEQRQFGRLFESMSIRPLRSEPIWSAQNTYFAVSPVAPSAAKYRIATMRLTRIEIENFKGIGAAQVIDLKPITLLFGPNSAGKSTILQSLHYLREILERRNADPDQTIAGGLIDLGGFATLVHGHDLNRAITLKVCVDLTDDQSNERLPLNSGGSLGDPDFSHLGIRYLVGENTELKEYAIVQDVALGLEVRWSDLLQAPYVAKALVEIDGASVAELHSPAQQGRGHLTAFNFAHPLLQAATDPDGLLDLADDTLATEQADTQSDLLGDPFSTPLGNEIWELSRETSADATENRTVEFRIAVETVLGALPDLDQPLGLDLVEIDQNLIRRRYAAGAEILRGGKGGERAIVDEYEMERRRRAGLNALLDELVLGPIRIVRDHLSSMTYVGPLREIPSRNFRPRLSPDETRWAQGLAAWDLLYTDTDGKLLEEVNAWLSREERLRTGYRLEKTAFKEIPIPSAFHQMFDRGLTEDDLGDLQELYIILKSRTEIALRDFEKGIIVAPRDVGVGISQMIPVIVGCLRHNRGILAIEQPELHVHPAIQVGIGDLFIRAIQPDGSLYPGKSLLIETHSEHIMLRLLRRIRETSAEDLPPGVTGLQPEDLSVVYAEGSDDGVSFRPLRVDRDGEFLDQWPKGFFEERAGELF